MGIKVRDSNGRETEYAAATTIEYEAGGALRVKDGGKTLAVFATGCWACAFEIEKPKSDLDAAAKEGAKELYPNKEGRRAPS